MVKWENIPQDTAGILQRTKVPGGWLVKEVHDVYVTIADYIPVQEGLGYTWTSTLTFVPDINHEWDINN